MRSEEYQRGYDAGYKQALLDALKQRDFDPYKKIGGPDSPFKPGNIRFSQELSKG